MNIPRINFLKSLTIAVFVLAFIFVNTGCFLLDARRSAYMSRAKGTLRSIGSSQLAYQSTNKDHLYGTFQALQDSMYIAEGYTLDNIVEEYNLTWWVRHHQYSEGYRSTFTIIAWPRERYNLMTFAVTEDQVVRVYNPESGNRLHEVQTWDPIL